MKPVVSIIIPVYKVEKYFAECMESVLNQTLQEIEVILVDDGSPDNCPRMCDQYAAQDNRVRVHHQKNAGVSVARNVGIKMAQGDWIMFVDPDDWLELDAAEVLYRKAVEAEVDIVMAAFVKNYIDCEVDDGEKEPFFERIYETEKYREHFLGACFATPKRNHHLFPEEMWLWPRTTFSWGKLFSADLLKENNLAYIPGLAFGEDKIFNLYALYYSKKVLFTNKRVLHYRIRGSSVSETVQCDPNKSQMPMHKYARMFMEEFGLVSELKKYQLLNIATFIISSVKAYAQGAESVRKLFACSWQLKNMMQNELIKEAVKEIPVQQINKYKLMFRLLKLRLYMVCILVYRIRYQRTPKESRTKFV